MTTHVGEVEIDYTNHRGERRKRVILPSALFYGVEEPWHPTPQWLLRAYDMEKREMRSFAMAGIHGWEPREKQDSA